MNYLIRAVIGLALLQALFLQSLYGSENTSETTVVWFDDAFPIGASSTPTEGDGWNWISTHPGPFSGEKALQSSISSRLNEYAFNWAQERLAVEARDTLFAYVYLDPNDTPEQIMLSWKAETWEHRAYWGADRIRYGADGTASRRYIGPLPVAGEWVRLEIPAAAIDLEGRTLDGMSFSLYGGRATWDYVGKTRWTPPSVTVEATEPVATRGDPAGNAAVTFTRTGDPDESLTVHYTLGGTAERLVDYRRSPEGDMPVSITIPAGQDSRAMNIEGVENPIGVDPATVTFNLSPSGAYIVGAKKSATITIENPPQPEPGPVESPVWFDDAVPSGAVESAPGGAPWNWVFAYPSPYSGELAHRTGASRGLHEYSFNWANATLTVNEGDHLYAHVYLDPRRPPSQIMLSWRAENWEHRAYWGADLIGYGTNGTSSRRHIGPIPAAGRWVRLEVPAEAVDLEGRTLRGMSFSLYGGRATWDLVGKTAASNDPEPVEPVPADPSPAAPPEVTMVALKPYATIGDWSDRATVAFTRTGDTGSPMDVDFTIGGTAVKWLDYRRREGDMPVSITIPADHASYTMEIVAVDNRNNADPATAVFTLAGRDDYLVGAADSATVTLLEPGAVFEEDGGAGEGDEGDVADGGGSDDSGSSDGDPVDSGTGGGADEGDEGDVADGGGSDDSADEGDVADGGDPVDSGTGGETGAVFDIATAPPVTDMDYLTLTQPQIGDTQLRIVSPGILALQYINTKDAGSSRVGTWDFVDTSGNLTAPSRSQFAVTVDGAAVAVEEVGFKRRALSAPLKQRDLRVENTLYLRLASPAPADGRVVVTNPQQDLWSPDKVFNAENHPLRYSPAIHVNQEGYMPGFAKQAMVGYYLGSLGEMEIPHEEGFHLVDAATGVVAHSGALELRADVGFSISPLPYQQVYEADFTAFSTPGQYLLVVPGLGASVPFRITEGVAMNFTRTYALGLYHQRSGAPNELPYTRFTHAGGHTDPADVPANESAYAFTWSVIRSEASKINSNNPPQIAPLLTAPEHQLYPFVNKGPIDVSGGHHDAGDYSKYTTNSASLIHELMFAVDSLPGVAALDNLGLPESGDGISDVMQLAKWEADFLVKMQDADGGFYFLVYPRERRYENNVLPDNGDLQVVWPKNTAASAAAVGALAEIASSPLFKVTYPEEAARYLEAAHSGWRFLTGAIAKHGKAGAYQKITHYGDNFTHDDELAWAATAMFVATGDPSIHETVREWYDPSSTSTRRWGWWRANSGWGNAARAYAFAARSGRLPVSALHAGHLGKCEAELVAAGDDGLGWSQRSAYGTSFPNESKRVHSAGWYFSGVQAFDIAVADRISPRQAYLDAIIANMNYEGGSNPVNVAYVTGMGRKRQHEIVHQYAQNDRRTLPPTGIPQGNLQTGPTYTGTYGTDLASLSFPRDNAGTAPYSLYDRWSDTFNVTTEFVHNDQARSLAAYAYVAAKTSLKNQAWKSGAVSITGLPEELKIETPLTVGIDAPGFDLSEATIVWEAAGQSPAFGRTYTFMPSDYGAQWVEAEIAFPDGRRLFAVRNFFADNDLPNATVVATDPNATIGSSTDLATFTFTRDGDTAEALTVHFDLGGSAVKWNDYRRPEGDMPSSMTIPAGAASVAMNIRAMGNSRNVHPLTVTVTVKPDASYNAGSPRFATATLHEPELATAGFTQESTHATSGESSRMVSGVVSSFAAAEPLGNAWWSSEWFGVFYADAGFNGWMHSADHGWIYVWPGQPEGRMWYWDAGVAAAEEADGFAYTTGSEYPYVYLSGPGWTYFDKEASGDGLRSFYLFASGEWSEFGLSGGMLNAQ